MLTARRDGLLNAFRFTGIYPVAGRADGFIIGAQSSGSAKDPTLAVFPEENFAMATVLCVYPTVAGQWAGSMVVDGEVWAGVGGCLSPEEVEEEAAAAGFEWTEVTRVDHALRQAE